MHSGDLLGFSLRRVLYYSSSSFNGSWIVVFGQFTDMSRIFPLLNCLCLFIQFLYDKSVTGHNNERQPPFSFTIPKDLYESNFYFLYLTSQVLTVLSLLVSRLSRFQNPPKRKTEVDARTQLPQQRLSSLYRQSLIFCLFSDLMLSSFGDICYPCSSRTIWRSDRS